MYYLSHCCSIAWGRLYNHLHLSVTVSVIAPTAAVFIPILAKIGQYPVPQCQYHSNHTEVGCWHIIHIIEIFLIHHTSNWNTCMDLRGFGMNIMFVLFTGSHLQFCICSWYFYLCVVFSSGFLHLKHITPSENFQCIYWNYCSVAKYNLWLWSLLNVWISGKWCWRRSLDEASDHILSFLDGRDAPVTGMTTTYRELRDTFDVIINCGYFSHPLSSTTAASRDTDVTTQTNGHDLHGL